MRFKRINTVLFILIPISFSIASGQKKATDENKEINEREFNEVIANAKTKLDGRVYRLTETEKYFADAGSEAETTRIDLLEIVPPDKRREVNQIISATEHKRLERIWDGRNLYKREDDGGWEKFSGGGNSGGGDINSGRISRAYWMLGNTELDGKKARLYLVEEKRIANKYTASSRYEVDYYENTEYWISENGLLLKVEKISGIDKVITEKGTEKPASVTKKTSIYTYDENITIEIPQIGHRG